MPVITKTAVSKDTLIRDVQSLATRLQRIPVSGDIRFHLGTRYENAATQYFGSLVAALPRIMQHAQSRVMPIVARDLQSLLNKLRDVTHPHAVEIAYMGYLKANPKYQSQNGVALKLSDLLDYIKQHGSSAIPRLWALRNRELDSVALPSRVALIGLRAGNRLYGLKLVNVSQVASSDLGENAMQLTFTYRESTRSFALTHAEGDGAISAALTYLENCGLHLTDQVERIYAVRLLGGSFGKNNLKWPELVSYFGRHFDFGQRLLNIHNHIKNSSAAPATNWVVVGMSDSTDQSANGIDVVMAAKAKDLPKKYFQLHFFEKGNGDNYIQTVKGDGAQELGFAWAAGRLGRVLETAEKIMLVTLWQSPFGGAAPLWLELLTYLKTNNALQNLWQVRSLVSLVDEKIPDTLYLIVRREVGRDKTAFSGLSLMPAQEFAQKKLDKSITRIKMDRNASGHFEITLAQGRSSVEVAEALVRSGYIDVAANIKMKDRADIATLWATRAALGDLQLPDAELHDILQGRGNPALTEQVQERLAQAGMDRKSPRLDPAKWEFLRKK